MFRSHAQAPGLSCHDRVLKEGSMPAISDHLRDMASPSEGRSREDCVRAAVACVRIEAGEVDAETQALLDRWGGCALSDSDLMEAILAPYVARR